MDDFKVLIEAVLDKAKLGKEFKDIQKIFDSQSVTLKPVLDKKILQKDLDKIGKDLDSLKKNRLNMNSKNSSAQKNLTFSKDHTAYSNLDLSNTQLQINRLNNSLKLAQSQIETVTKKLGSIKSNSGLSADFEHLVSSLQTLSAEDRLNVFNQQLGTLKSEVHSADIITQSWGKSLNNIFSEIEDRFNLGILAKFALQETEKSINELKEIDSILTEISVSTAKTKASLEGLGISAVNNASKYGTLPSNYLNSMREMSEEGFNDTQSERLAELSTIAQSAGSMTSELADSYIIASNAAYNYHGNIQKLNALLDSQNQVASRNSISFAELASATKVASSQLAQLGIDEKKLTALLSTGISASNKSGEAVGNAVNGIVMTLRQITGKTALGNIVDENSLRKAEARCRSLGIELEHMKNGIFELRDPITVLKELADVYNTLPDGSNIKSGIISDIGGEYGSDVLSSILENWDSYSKMFSDYNNSEGTALENAMTTANSWGGQFQQISNNWTGFIQTLATDDFTSGVLSIINKFVLALKELSQVIGGIPTIAAGIGIFKFVKNFG